MKKANYIVCIVIESLVLIMGAFFAWAAMNTHDKNTDAVTPMYIGMFAFAFLIVSIICLAKKLEIFKSVFLKFGCFFLVVGIILANDNILYLICGLVMAGLFFAVPIIAGNKKTPSVTAGKDVSTEASDKKAVVYKNKNKNKSADEAEDDYTKKYTQKLLEKYRFPYTIFKKGTSSEELNEAYRKALERGQKEGFIPFVIMIDSVLLESFYMNYEDYDAEEFLKGEIASGKEYLDKAFEEESEQMGDLFNEDCDNAIKKALADNTPNDDDFLTTYSPIKSEAVIFEIPTDKPWKLVAYFPMGNWNGCPGPEDMTAVCKYWYEEYGAIPTLMEHDILQFRLPKPIPPEKAVEVSKEHFAFDIDTFGQGYNLLSECASALVKSDRWYFWWD